MLKWLQIAIVCIGVIGVLLALPAPTYERTDEALNSLTPDANSITDDFSNMGMIYSAVRYRLLMNPSEDYIHLLPAYNDGKSGWILIWADVNGDVENENSVVNSETFYFSSEESRDNAYYLVKPIVDIPQYDTSGFWSDLANAVMNILVIVTSLFAFVSAFVFVFVDIVSITFSLIRVLLVLVGFPV